MSDSIFKRLIDKVIKKIYMFLSNIYEKHPIGLTIFTYILFITIYYLLLMMFLSNGLVFAIFASLFLTFVILGTISTFFLKVLYNSIFLFFNKVQQLNKEDILGSKDYFRNLILNYSISELIYVDNFTEDYRRIIITTLLKLINRNIVKIENNRIKITNNYQYNLKLYLYRKI